MTFTAPSPPFIAARWSGGPQTPRLIVLHSTVGPTKLGSAKNVADFFAREDNKTSAHYVVDAGSKYQCVSDHTVAYHCGHNQDSIGIEMCDTAGPNLRRWDDPDHRSLERRTARLVAKLCLVYGIRPWYVSVVGLKLGVRGVTTHNNMSLAFRQSTHTDPGAWPRRRFMREVRRQVRALKAGL
jgi:N-acetylmuramoyl-L-alanine amidase CwlA